jgi:polyhydroxyalkanoate synthesis repressor PhaR
LATTQLPGGDPATGSPTAEITRYPNRRLYDRSRGRYVTLQEIADTVRAGQTVLVRDSKTGEDVTRAVLTQVILEHHPERMELLPVGVLHSMIRANAAVLGFLSDYFRQALVYLDVLQRSAPLNPFVPPADWMRFFFPQPVPAAPAESPAPAAPDTEALARRVADLEKRLEQMNASARSPHGAPRGRGKGRPGSGRGPS